MIRFLYLKSKILIERLFFINKETRFYFHVHPDYCQRRRSNFLVFFILPSFLGCLGGVGRVLEGLCGIGFASLCSQISLVCTQRSQHSTCDFSVRCMHGHPEYIEFLPLFLEGPPISLLTAQRDSKRRSSLSQENDIQLLVLNFEIWRSTDDDDS